MPAYRPEGWPTCPECGLPAAVAECSRMTVVRGGRPNLVKPHPAGPAYRCKNEHWFTKGGASIGGPPEDITVKWGLLG